MLAVKTRITTRTPLMLRVQMRRMAAVRGVPAIAADIVLRMHLRWGMVQSR